MVIIELQVSGIHQLNRASQKAHQGRSTKRTNQLFILVFQSTSHSGPTIDLEYVERPMVE